MLGLAVGGAAAASTVSATGPQEATVYACEAAGHVPVGFTSTPSAACPAGTRSIKVGAPVAPVATPSTPAAFAPQPTQLSQLWTQADPPLVAPTGGKFCPDPPACSGGAVLAGHLGLPAGTWQVTLTADAEPNAGTPTDTSVNPKFFVYTQVKNKDFAGDALNIGAGALDVGHGHDSYYTGSGVVTLSSHTELFVYAFGYDGDTGAGSYNMVALTLTAVSVPATVTPPTT